PVPELRRLFRVVVRLRSGDVRRRRTRVCSGPRQMSEHPAVARYARHVTPAFVRLLGTLGYGRVYVRARGTRLYDADGRAYLDCLAGFGVTTLGHNPPKLIERVQTALGEELPSVMHVG